MKLEFELILKISGSSLQEIDEGLIQAAGERLKSRILGGLKMPTINSSESAAPKPIPSGNGAVVPSPVPIPKAVEKSISDVAQFMTRKGDLDEKNENENENEKNQILPEGQVRLIPMEAGEVKKPEPPIVLQKQ